MVLLLIVAVPLFFSAGFLIKQHIIKLQMKSQLETAAVQTISIPVSAVRWLNKKTELLVEGRMFDVRSYKIINDVLVAEGLFDDEEDRLNKKLEHFIEQEESGSSALGNLLAAFFSEPISMLPLRDLATPDWRLITQHFPQYSEEIPVAPFLSETPPPKL